MDPIKKQEFLKALEEKVESARTRAQKTLQTAKAWRHASRSQQGDKLYFQNAAKMSEDQYLDLAELKKEIAAAPENPCSAAQPPCFLIIKYQDGTTQEFYFVQSEAKASGLPLLTPFSPLGKGVLGKKEGQNFTYKVERDGEKNSFSGQIQKIR
jgi:transcription elongation GreA/GreB family factor